MVITPLRNCAFPSLPDLYGSTMLGAAEDYAGATTFTLIHVKELATEPDADAVVALPKVSLVAALC